MLQKEQSFCFCTLALGKKYRSLACLLAKDIEIYSPGTSFVILTDRPKDFTDYTNVLAFKHHQHHVYPYHDKRFVIAKAISMFDCCLFIDADMRILAQVKQDLEWLPGITARTGCSIIQHNQKKHKNMELIQKTEQKLNIDLEGVKFINEFLFAVKKDFGKEMEFLKQWQILAYYFELNGVYDGEGNVMGLAAAKVSFPVRFDQVDRISFFKDKIEKVRIKKGQVDSSEKLIYFEQQKQLEFPQKSIYNKVVTKLNKFIAYVYRSAHLRLLCLKDFNFYYRLGKE